MSQPRKFAWWLLVLSLATLLAVQTGAVSSMTADRTVNVNVAEDENAYLGIYIDPITVEGERLDDATLATFANQFGYEISLAVTVTDPTPADHPTLEDVRAPAGESLSTGETTDVLADVVCNGSTATEDFDLDIEATGAGMRMTADRTVSVSCG